MRTGLDRVRTLIATSLRRLRITRGDTAPLAAICSVTLVILAQCTSQPASPVGPDIDFYLLLDDSPSMTVPATLSGISAMVARTPQLGGCAFACHQTGPLVDDRGNPLPQDNYALARSLGLTLRIDAVRTAVRDLASTAQAAEKNNGTTYRMAMYTFDSKFSTLSPLTADLGAIGSRAGGIDAEIVYANNSLTAANLNMDEDTDYDLAMSRINLIIPDSVNGAQAGGPQDVLVIVTDGVEDENRCPAKNAMGGTCRQQFPMNANTDWCTAIKDRGIRIAVLYTEYLPLPTNQWYLHFIAPFQSQIGPQLRACASPGLYAEAATGGDISAALNTLFQKAVAATSK